jgi:Tfp pilus assembly protein PilO
MGSRERLIASIVVAVVAVLAMWILLVEPKRNDANALLASINAERAALATDQQQLAAAEQARVEYPAEVHSLKLLAIAAPTSDEEPQLIGTINRLETTHSVNYSSTSIGAPSAASGGLPTIALQFAFTGSYANLQSFLGQFDSLTLASGSNVRADGRLVSVSSISLAPLGSHISASVNMTAYEAAPATPEIPTTPATTP